MWNEFYSITGSGTMGAGLGAIWIVGIGLATYAWFKLPPSRRR